MTYCGDTYIYVAWLALQQRIQPQQIYIGNKWTSKFSEVGRIWDKHLESACLSRSETGYSYIFM